MPTSNPCRAKDPTHCWKHGDQQGLQAQKLIVKALTNNKSGGYHISNEQLFTAPIKSFNSQALAKAIVSFAKKTEGIDEEKIKEAILFSTHVHRNDLRSNRKQYEKTPYIEHPLRNTVRLIRFGCTDQATLIASLLHDTVEDHPQEISDEFTNNKALTEEEARENCFKYISDTFGTETEATVRGMSNPILPKYMASALRNKEYAIHVEDAIEDPRTCICKASDFIDNAVGLYHNESSMSKEGIRRRATKYLPVCDIIQTRLERDLIERKLPISDEGLKKMIKQIKDGRVRLLSLLDN